MNFMISVNYLLQIKISNAKYQSKIEGGSDGGGIFPI